MNRNILKSQLESLSVPLAIGNLPLVNRSFLAPLSGITDAPFRRLASRFGAGLVISEMVASEALIGGNAEMRLKALSAGLPVHAVQLAGREEKWMRLAAIMAEGEGANLIDINMGCPARRVTGGECGSALMRDLDHAARLIASVVDAVNVPVTLKMRLGWDSQSLNAPELARRAEAFGVKMITVHGRTRCQFYDGVADWSAISAVRAATSLPLVVNGDIRDAGSAAEALRLSGADAVMTGRAACGAPWLPGQIGGALILPFGEAPEGLGELVASHYEDMLSHYGVANGIRQARKHLSWYFEKWAPKAGEAIRRSVLTSTDTGQIMRLIGEIFGGNHAALASRAA